MSDENLEEKTSGEPTRVFGLIVDFDYVLFDGTPLLRDACIGAFKDIGAAVDEAVFLRKLFGARTLSALDGVLRENAATAQPVSVLEAIGEKMEDAIDKAQPRKSVVDICRKVIASGGSVIFVTSRSIALTEKKLAKLEMDDCPVMKVDRCDRVGVYGSDVWQRAARILRLNTRYCMTLTAAAHSARTSVLLGMKTAAIAPQISSYQDYSGVDYFAVADSESVDKIVALIDG